MSPTAVEPENASPVADTEAESIISLRDVHKRFGRLLVLRGVNLEIAKGHTTVILGPSGCGKSVLLKHIVGLLKPDRGEVYFEDHRVDSLSERDLVQHRKRFGFLFQMGALFDSLTVGENICFPLVEHTSMTRAQRREKCSEVLAMVGLRETESKMPAQLSGGQRKRIALARAIVLDPDVILYDEPTTGLDPIRSDVINELILKLQRKLNVTSIVVTHDMASAFKIADRIIMLYDGRFLFDGSAEAIRRSQDPTVRHFVEGRAQPDELRALDQG